jgi:hypothetical protein
MGWLYNLFKDDLEAMKPPKKLRYFRNKETGEYAFEVVNQPNKLVPITSRSYSNPKKGIYITESVDEEDSGDGFWAQAKKLSSDKKKTQFIEYGD